MVRAPDLDSLTVAGFPHARGDGPFIADVLTEKPSFPHARGDGPFSSSQASARFRFPHARGDGPLKEWLETRVQAFSPRPWGWSDHQFVP